jgi:two-component system, response regulator RpfG
LDNAFQPAAVILDDQDTSRTVLAAMLMRLDWSIAVQTYAEPRACLAAVADATPDLMLVDYRMPGMTGIEFTARFRALPDCAEVPLVMVTVANDRLVRLQALEAGATDFLLKPVDFHECRARCHNLLTLRYQHLLIGERARFLESKVSAAAHTVLTRERETMLRLARAGEFRDHETGHHIERVAHYVRLIGAGLNLAGDEWETTALAAMLHDIGTIGVPDRVLLDKARHTPEKTALMRRHTAIGHQILRDSPSGYLRIGAEIALHHHERFDGAGYPAGLAGTDIPLAARVTAVADVLDALTSHRPYRRAWTMTQAIEYMRCQAGTQFDPECVQALLRSWPQVSDVYYEFRDHARSEHLVPHH